MEKQKILEAYDKILLKEARNDKDFYYMNAILGKVKGLKVNGWELDYDPMVGTFSWVNSRYPDWWLYMTPFWEGMDGIAVNLDNAMTGDSEISDTIRFKPTYDSRTDAKTYVKYSQKFQRRAVEIIQAKEND